MTPAAPDGPGTAIDLLFGPGANVPEALARQIVSADASQDRALRNLPQATREAAVHEAAAQAAGLLDVNLIGLLMAGWRVHHDLVDAARRTLAAPSSTELVDLVEHQITARQQPSVAILVDGRRVAIVELDLSIEFDVSTAVAEMRAGLLVAIRSGHCDATAALAIQGTNVATRHARLELPGVIPFRPGIRVLPDDDYRAAREPGNPAGPVRTGDHDRDDPGPAAAWWQRTPP
jgi:hypothetical protein